MTILVRGLRFGQLFHQLRGRKRAVEIRPTGIDDSPKLDTALHPLPPSKNLFRFGTRTNSTAPGEVERFDYSAPLPVDGEDCFLPFPG